MSSSAIELTPLAQPVPLPLSQLRAGQLAEVDRVDGSSEFLHRLAELGLCCGAQVRMIRPGSPCIFWLAGQKLCVRAAELECILVHPCPLVTGVPA